MSEPDNPDTPRELFEGVCVIAIRAIARGDVDDPVGLARKALSFDPARLAAPKTPPEPLEHQNV